MSHIIRDSSVVVQTPSFSTRSMAPSRLECFRRCCCQHTSPRHSADTGGGMSAIAVCVVAPRAACFPASITKTNTPRPCRLTNATVASARSSRRLAVWTERAPGLRASRHRRWGPRCRSGRRGVYIPLHTCPSSRRHPYSPTPPRPVQADRGASRADIQLTHRLAPRSRPLPSSPLSLRRFPSPCPDPRRNSPWAR